MQSRIASSKVRSVKSENLTVMKIVYWSIMKGHINTTLTNLTHCISAALNIPEILYYDTRDTGRRRYHLNEVLLSLNV